MASFNPQRLMVVHAHPDDETIFTGHIIAHALRADAQVKLVTLTRGQGGHAKNPKLRVLNQAPAEMATFRSAALVKAAEVFEGLEKSFFGTRNYLETNQDSIGLGKLLDRDPLYPLTLTGSGVTVVAEELVPVLKKFRPDAIVTLSSKNKNSDHKMAFKAVRKAIKMLRTSRPPKHFVVLEPGESAEISIGDEYTASVKRTAMKHYADFVALTEQTFDFGTGEIRFSEQEKLRLVN
jgi:N-acetyl-1-D-myo-inositol-2-amino-2-deoxy-alpha-D-glucopyranoside deacetylase